MADWLGKLCRQLGLTIHQVITPAKLPVNKQTVRHDVEEKQVSPTVTLRRTTIEEIEVKHDSTPGNHSGCSPEVPPET